MPSFDLGNNEQSPVQEVTGAANVNSNENLSEDFSTGDLHQVYSNSEISDPNSITVKISDVDTPLIIFFGHPSSGKTMTLIRLTRYLKSKGYTISPVEHFRPSTDKNYGHMCNNFNNMIASNDAAKSTNNINFMLIKVSYKGKAICQILEGPGEGYFDPNDVDKDFPNYVNTIINSKNRKIWTIMLEPVSTNSKMSNEMSTHYVNKIHNLKKKVSLRDKFIFLYNKIDSSDFVVSPGQVNLAAAKKDIADNFQNLFVPFTNNNPITKIWKPFNFAFVPFSTGNYSKKSEGGLTYTESPEVYPRSLWNIMLKYIKG